MIRYRKGYKYQLVTTYGIQTSIKGSSHAIPFCSINMDGWLWVKAGYAWDGPSGPCPDVPCAMRGSLVHDALYELMRIGGLPRTNKDAADLLLYTLCKEDGMEELPARLILEGVEWFGKRFTEENAENPVIEVGK
jgi:hypothetical protein